MIGCGYVCTCGWMPMDVDRCEWVCVDVSMCEWVPVDGADVCVCRREREGCIRMDVCR